MDKEIKTKWVKALRSGRYKQGKTSLLDDNGEYCCLGVLAKEQGAKKQEILFESFLTGDNAKYNAGITTKSQGRLAEFNDGCEHKDILPKSFKEIADYIEKHYK